MTAAELTALLVAAGVPADLAASGPLQAYFAGAIAAAELAAEPALYEAISAGLTGTPKPASIAAAKALAKRQAKQITGNLVTAQINAIGQIVADNVAAGKNPRDIIGALRDVVTGLDTPRARRLDKYAQYLDTLGLSADEKARRLDRQKQKLLRDRRETIARTEQRFATSAGNRLEAEGRGAMFKASVSARDDRVSDVCQANEAAGPIPIGEPFPSGDQVPPFHPNCRCTLAYQSTEAQRDRSARRAEQRATQTAAAKEGNADA
jgi:hypothetical protein